MLKLNQRNFFHRSNYPLLIIVMSGLLLRIFFSLKGGAIYYGHADFHIQGDTYGWMNSILNLINHGTYSSDLSLENGKFFRPPGYSFIMGICYILCGKNIDLAFELLVWLQIAMDVCNIYLFYRILKNNRFTSLCGLTGAALYSFYPFIIVWTPVLYAETSSIFFMLLSLYVLSKATKPKNYFMSALLLGISALCRLQAVFLFPAILLSLYIYRKGSLPAFYKIGSYYVLGFLLSYGLWPLRNYVNHQRILFTQDIRVGGNYSADFTSFKEFMYSVQVDVEPAYSQFLNNLPVTWPKAAYLLPGDSAKLKTLEQLCSTCGTGFSYFKFHKGTIKMPVDAKNKCDSTIYFLFHELTQNQKKLNKWHCYVTVPLGNFQKAVFKSSLYGDKSRIVRLLTSGLFLYRTILILLGLIGCLLIYKNKFLTKGITLAILLYFTSWYLYVCVVLRHVEIRFLLHADILLLIPAAYTLQVVVKKIKLVRIPEY